MAIYRFGRSASKETKIKNLYKNSLRETLNPLQTQTKNPIKYRRRKGQNGKPVKKPLLYITISHKS